MGVGNISSKNITNRIVFETEAVTPSIVYTIGDPWSVRDVRIVNCHSAILSRSITYTFELPFPHIVRIEILPSVEKIETASVVVSSLLMEVMFGVILEVISSFIIVPIV